MQPDVLGQKSTFLNPTKPVVTTATQNKLTSDQYTKFLNAKILCQNDEWALARVLIYDLLNQLPKHPEFLNLIASQSKQLTQLEQLKIFQELALQNPNFDTSYNLAQFYYTKGEDDLALGQFMDTLNYGSDDIIKTFEVYKSLGNIYVRTKKFENAQKCFEKALVLNKYSDAISINMGTLAIQRNDLNSSLYYYREAVKVNPRNDKAWVGLALSHHQMGDFHLAKANLENAIEINPVNKTALILLANWTVQDKTSLSICEHLENYLSLVEEFDSEISLILIQIFCENEQWAMAKLEIERNLLWHPLNENTLVLEREIQKYL